MPIDIGSNHRNAEKCALQNTSIWKKTVLGSVAIWRLRSKHQLLNLSPCYHASSSIAIMPVLTPRICLDFNFKI